MRHSSGALMLVEAHDDMHEAAIHRPSRRMRGGRRRDMEVAGVQLAIAEGEVALENERLFVGVVRVRVIGRAGRHPDQQILPVLRAVDMEQPPFDAGADIEPVRPLPRVWSGCPADRAFAVDPVENLFEQPGGAARPPPPAGRKRRSPNTRPGPATPRPISALRRARGVLLAEQAEDILGRSWASGFTGSDIAATSQRHGELRS